MAFADAPRRARDAINDGKTPLKLTLSHPALDMLVGFLESDPIASERLPAVGALTALGLIVPPDA